MADLNSPVYDPDCKRPLISVSSSDTGSMGTVRRVSSAPSVLPSSSCSDSSSISHAKQGSRLKLYVCNRAFTSWANGAMERLPEPWKSITQDMGLCHYMVIVQEVTNSRLHMFDFGPVGGETTLHMEQVYDTHTNEVRAGAAGEIRENIISQLPEGAMYAGCTDRWSLDDIRLHNMQQPTTYRLHENDCRHYVNNLVKQMTGLEGANVRLLQHNFARRTRQEKEAWLSSLLGTHEESPCSQYSTAQTTAMQPSTAARGVYDAMSATSGSSKTHGTHVAPLVLPLLTKLPSWDAPLVLLGQLLSNPFHWQTVHTACQAAAMSFGTAVSLKSLAVSRATSLTPAVAASLVLATSGNLSQAIGTVPHVMEKLRASTTPPTTAVSRFPAFPYLTHGLAQAKAAATIIKRHAVQAAASVVAIGQAHGSKNKGKAASSSDDGIHNSNLPALQRLPFHAAGKLQPNSTYQLPTALLAATEQHGVQSWHMNGPQSLTISVHVQPVLLPAEALQAAIIPEGPVTTAVVPKKRLLPKLTGAVKQYTSSVASVSKASLARLNSTTQKGSSVMRSLVYTPLTWLSTALQPVSATEANMKPIPLVLTKELLQSQPSRCVATVPPIPHASISVAAAATVPSIDQVMQPLELQQIQWNHEPASPRQTMTFLMPSKPVARSVPALKLICCTSKSMPHNVDCMIHHRNVATKSCLSKPMVDTECKKPMMASKSSKLKEIVSIHSSGPASVLSLLALIMTHAAQTSLTA